MGCSTRSAGTNAWSWASPSAAWSHRSLPCAIRTVCSAWCSAVPAVAERGGASYPLHELAHLSPQGWAQRVVELSDMRRDAAWQAANGQEFQTLIDEMLAIRAGSAAEPGCGRWGTPPN